MNYTKELANLLIKIGNELNELVKEQTLEKKNTQIDKLMNEKEVLEKYSFFNKTSLYRAYTTGDLVTYKINSHRFYKESDIQNWIENHKVKPTKSLVKF